MDVESKINYEAGGKALHYLALISHCSWNFTRLCRERANWVIRKVENSSSRKKVPHLFIPQLLQNQGQIDTWQYRMFQRNQVVVNLIFVGAGYAAVVPKILAFQ